MTSIDVWLGEGQLPKVEADGTSVRIVLDDITTVEIGGRGRDEIADRVRQFATDLLGAADVMSMEHERGKRYVAEASEYIAKMRREHGEISPDGECWPCKLGDHSGHKEHHEGRCYGCSCTEALA